MEFWEALISLYDYDNGYYKCNVCGHKTKAEWAIWRHIDNKHPDKLYELSGQAHGWQHNRYGFENNPRIIISKKIPKGYAYYDPDKNEVVLSHTLKPSGHGPEIIGHEIAHWQFGHGNFDEGERDTAWNQFLREVQAWDYALKRSRGYYYNKRFIKSVLKSYVPRYANQYKMGMKVIDGLIEKHFGKRQSREEVYHA